MPETFDFGTALSHLRQGARVSREGWNGQGMYLALQVPDEHSKMRLLSIAGILLLLVGLSALGAWIFQSLWNFALVSTFGAPHLSFYVAWAICVLLSFLTVRINKT